MELDSRSLRDGSGTSSTMQEAGQIAVLRKSGCYPKGLKTRNLSKTDKVAIAPS